MKLRLPFVLSLSLLSACIVPPSLYERASWGPPPGGSWEQDGRYRPAPGAQQAPAASGETDPSAQRTDVASNAIAPSQEDAPRDPALTPGPAPATAEPPLYAWDGDESGKVERLPARFDDAMRVEGVTRGTVGGRGALVFVDDRGGYAVAWDE